MPWLTRLPSSYIREHVRFTTQPLETPEDPHKMVGLIELSEALDMLVYSSDYPHWDGDVPTYVSSILPDAWHAKVFHRNAQRVLRMPAGIELGGTAPQVA